MELLPVFAALPIATNYSASDNSTGEDLPALADELFHGYSSGLLKFASAACIVFILLGVPGNLITIIALARCKKVRNATAVFIINLSLSDLLFCCFNLPLAASTFWHRAWTHGDLLCRLFPLLRYGLLAVSLFTVLAITINRYVMIGHPRIYPRIYRRKYLAVMVAATWLCAFGALIPTWRGAWGTFGLDTAIGSCSILKDPNGHSPKEFLFIMAFALPCLFIVICYARIFYIVRKTAMRSRDPVIKSMGSVKSIRPERKPQEIPDQRGKKIEDNVNVNNDHLLQRSNQVPSHPTGNDKIPDDAEVNRPLTNGHNNLVLPEMEESSESSITVSRENCIQQTKKHLSKFRDDEFKFIDTSIDSDMPPTISELKVYEPKSLTKADRNPSSVSISKSVEFASESDYESRDKEMKLINYPVRIKSSLKKTKPKKKLESDSAVESSTSSSDNNQMYFVASDTPNSNQLLSVQVEPSSSSGIDIPMDQESPPRRDKRSFAASLKRSLKRPKDKGGGGGGMRKHSTMNTSGASILYPGRMTSKDRRLLKMILVIFISFLICYLPITLTKIFRAVTDLHFVNIMGYLLIYLTTCINPIIYVVMSSEYRQAYWNLLMCRANNSRGKHEAVCRGSPRT